MISSTLTLHTDGLYSKYGFNDGDMPEHIEEWFQQKGINSEDVDWHETLFNIVEAYVFPLVELGPGQRLQHFSTAHNPARIVDEEGNDTWSNGDFGGETVCVDIALLLEDSIVTYFAKEDPEAKIVLVGPVPQVAAPLYPTPWNLDDYRIRDANNEWVGVFYQHDGSYNVELAKFVIDLVNQEFEL